MAEYKYANRAKKVQLELGVSKGDAEWRLWVHKSFRIYDEHRINLAKTWGEQDPEVQECAINALSAAMDKAAAARPKLCKDKIIRLKQRPNWRFYHTRQNKYNKTQEEIKKEARERKRSSALNTRPDAGLSAEISPETNIPSSAEISPETPSADISSEAETPLSAEISPETESQPPQRIQSEDKQFVDRHLKEYQQFLEMRQEPKTVLESHLRIAESIVAKLLYVQPAADVRIEEYNVQSHLDRGKKVLVYRSASFRRLNTTGDFLKSMKHPKNKNGKERFERIVFTDYAKGIGELDAGSGEQFKIDNAIEKFNNRGSIKTVSSLVSGGDVNIFEAPMNCLDLKYPSSMISSPDPLTGNQYQLLHKLLHQTRQPRQPNDGESRTTNLTDPFALVAHEDAISPPHHDHHGVGTWLTIHSGMKLWIYWPNMTGDDWTAFKEDGVEWTGGTPEYVLLRPGDTLIMGAGHAVPHMVITLEDCLATGGFFWDAGAIPRILESIIELELEGVKKRDMPVTTNQELSPQLVLAFRKLKDYIEDPQKGYDIKDVDNPHFRQRLDYAIRKCCPESSWEEAQTALDSIYSDAPNKRRLRSSRRSTK